MSDTKELKCEITPEQIYLSGIPTVPDGWEVLRFGMGPLGGGEKALCSAAEHEHRPAHLTDTIPDRSPRIIVRRRPHAFVGWNGAPEFTICGECGNPKGDPIHHKQPAPPKPRRWVVEFEDCPTTDPRELPVGQQAKYYRAGFCYYRGEIKIVCEVRPIRRQDLAMSEAAIAFLRGLGLEVEG